MADDTIMEELEELMVSPSGGEVHLRTAHFLKPSITSVDGPVAAPSPAGAARSCKGLPLKVNYVGWGYHPLHKWKEWVEAMCSSHHSTWKTAGILDAIMCSTFFITLEDMMVLGGYSVLGESVLIPPGDVEVEEKVTKLLGARQRVSTVKLLPRHSAAKPAFTSKSSDRKFVECLSAEEISDHNHPVSLVSAPKCSPIEASDLGPGLQNKVTEIDGNHQPQGGKCLFSAPRNGNVGQVMSSVETEAKSKV